MQRIILNFHGIGQPQRDLEQGEAPYWVSLNFLETSLDLADRLSDRVQTDFTFDDGNRSDVEVAAALARRGRRGSFFVLADRIGQPGSLGEDDIRAMAGQGHVIGTHGAAHVDWRAASTTVLDRELTAARSRIAEASGRPVDDAAIPFGRWNGRVLQALRQVGYAKVYSSDGGGWSPGDYPIARTSVRMEMTAEDVKAILLAREPASRRARRWAAVWLKRRL